VRDCLCWSCEQRRLRRERRYRLLRACYPESAVSLRQQVRAVERILEDFGVRLRAA